MTVIQELTNLFDSLYSHFILRDLLAKVVPGLVLLSCIAITLTSPIQFFDYVQEMSKWAWIVALAFCWLAALGLQGLGDLSTFIIRYFARDIKEEDYYADKARFGKVSSHSEKQVHERLVVIMEACGNGYFALAVSLVLILIKNHLNPSYLEYWPFNVWVLVLPIVPITVGLGAMHFKNCKRHHLYMVKIIDSYSAS